MTTMKWKIEELLEREPPKGDYPSVLYRGDWFQRPGCRCSGLVSKYAQRFCGQLGKPSVTGNGLLERIKPLLKTYLPKLPWKDSIPNWDALVLAQHYGLDTRFLDWSSDPSVALYFATHKITEKGKYEIKNDKDGDSVIWICNLDKATHDDISISKLYVGPERDEDDTPFWRGKSLRTLFYKPKDNLGKRVENQGSVMCRQVFRPKDQAYGRCYMVPLDQNVDFRDAIEHVVILASDYAEIDRELLKKGIADDSIFPDRNKNWCKSLEKALKPLSSWPRCPWER